MRTLLFLLLLLSPLATQAATLYFSPSSGNYDVGKTITVSVYVSSPEEAVNAVSASLSVPSDLYSIVSASSVGSVINFWVSQPTVSGNTVSFEGVVLNPGYQGTAGKVATLVLSPKKAGSGGPSFVSASVLANDGQGTNILSGTTDASYTIGGTQPPATPAATPQQSTPTQAAPSAFVIQSTTHPEGVWSRQKTGTFSWTLPQGATATRIILSSSPSGVPSVEYIPAVSEKTIEGLPEGVSYLRVQHKVGGVWGGIGTYTIRVDSIPPERFTIVFPHGDSGFDPQPIILFNTIDGLSGIAHYSVKVGDGSLFETAAPADSNPYVLPLQDPGAHVVSVTAFDKAGNSLTMTEGFYVEGIDPPKITYISETISYGDLIKTRGITYPNSHIDVVVRDEDGDVVAEEPTKSNSLGDFGSIITKQLPPGLYSVTARVTDARGARSVETEPLSVEVEAGFLVDFWFFMLEHSGVAFLILLILLGSVGVHIYGWRKLLLLTHGVHAQRVSAAETVHKAFAILKKDVSTHMRQIREAGKTRMLTKEELAFLEEFEGELEEAEEIVEKEVEKAKKRT